MKLLLILLNMGCITIHAYTQTNPIITGCYTKNFYEGTTICFIETTTLYDGSYVVTVTGDKVKESLF